MDISKKNRTVNIIAIAALILVISFPGIASAVKAVGPEYGWRAQLLFHGHPAALRGPDPLSPSQIIDAYNLNSATGGAGMTIAIVDAYDDPTIANDLATFSSYFGLPAANFVKHKMATTISVNSGWALETSLDVEWAHAIAPQATILLVEAKSNSPYRSSCRSTLRHNLHGRQGSLDELGRKRILHRNLLRLVLHHTGHRLLRIQRRQRSWRDMAFELA